MILQLNAKQHQVMVKLQSAPDGDQLSKETLDRFLDILAVMVAEAYLEGQSWDQAA